MAEVEFNFARILLIVPFYWIQIAAQCFTKDFKFGVASSAYQIEGAWNYSGKGESIWDHLTHNHPEQIIDNSNADITADSFHHWQKDAFLLHKLGVQYYRFSISWSRILPNGLSNEVNADGIRYYNNLLDELSRREVLPLITMYHWDLPQYLQDIGGWSNPVLATYFVDYARVLFDSFGDKVKCWMTFNEPAWFCREGYGGAEAPGSQASGHQDYLCGHTVLRAHAMVYHLYNREYRTKQKGTVGILLDLAWKEPATETVKDRVAAEKARQFLFGWFANPIMSNQGDYPDIMRQRIDAISKLQGFGQSRLPTFTKREVKMIRGSYDFLGFNNYAAELVKEDKEKISKDPNFYSDMGVKIIRRTEWPALNSSWFKNSPKDLRKSLSWIKENYYNPKVIVTESGFPSFPGLHDFHRVEFLHYSLTNLHDAMIKDNCRVVGYTFWSLMDNFEWLRGFAVRFGLHEVDFESPRRTRTPRLSALYYRQVVKTKCVPYIERYKLKTTVSSQG